MVSGVSPAAGLNSGQVDQIRLIQRFPVSVKFVDVSPAVEVRVGMNGNVRIDTRATPR